MSLATVTPCLMPSASIVCRRNFRTLFSLLLATIFTLVAMPAADAQGVSGSVSLVPVITTVAGDGTQNFSGDGGPAVSASLNNSSSVAVDSAGNLYIADGDNNRIRKVDPSGNISTVAGNGNGGFGGDGSAATSAELFSPLGVAVDGAGNLYITDSGNNRIRKVDTSGNISTVAGNGTQGSGGDGGPATSAEFNHPFVVAVDGAGNLYIADTFNNVIRKVDTSGKITTVAGNGAQGFGGNGGPATSATLNRPYDVAVDGAGNLYIADTQNQVIRKVDTSGNINTVAGNGTFGFSGDGGLATSAELHNPFGVAVDGAGNLYIADTDTDHIRKVDHSGNISTVAGNGTNGFSGDGGAATSAELSNPLGVAVDRAGNLYIVDANNSRIRKVSTSATLPATAVASSSASQNVFVQLTAASAISSIGVPKAQNGMQEFTVGAVMGCTLGTTSNASGTVCTVPITFNPQYSGQRTGALTLYRSGTTIVGTVGLFGTGNGPQVALTPGTISTVAGNGTQGFGGDSGAATSAELNYPVGVAVDSAGNLYIADEHNSVIRKVDPSGNISTVAGNGTEGFGGDSGLATSAKLDLPINVAVDGAGNLYIADTFSHRIRKVDPSGTISTVAGNGTFGFSGDGSAATSAELYYPHGVAVDGTGNLYIADTINNRIRKVDPSRNISTVAGNETSGFSGDGSAATSAQLGDPDGVAVDGAGNLYIADTNNNRIRKVDVSAGSLGFASTANGATSADSPQTATVSNIGNAALTISVPASGLNPSVTTNFTLGNSGTCPQLDTTSSTATVAPGSSCTLRLSFTPTVSGALTGTASIADNSLNASSSVQQFSLSGTGTGPAVTTIALNAPSTAVYGASTTLTATVLSGGSPVTTGTVTFYTGTTSLGTASVNSNGVATLTTTALPVGADSITASYGATSNYAASTSTASSIAVAAASTTTTLTSSAGAITAGQSVTFTAAVESGTTPVTVGTVTFYIGSTSIGTGTLNAQGMATLTTTTLPVGTDSIAASYGGAANFTASTSTASSITVTAASTTTTLTSSAGAITAGQSVTFTAAVESGTTPVTVGTVTFYTGTTSIGTGALNAQGIATFATSTLPVGTDSITASYGATSIYAASTSTAVTVTVTPPTPASFAIVLTPPTLNVTQGQTASTMLTLNPAGGYIGPQLPEPACPCDLRLCAESGPADGQ